MQVMLLYPLIKDDEFLTIDNKGFFLLRRDFLVTWFDPLFCCCFFTVNLKTRELNELKNKVLKLKTYKKELLSALGEFLDEHFPPPEEGENIKKKVRLFFTY